MNPLWLVGLTITGSIGLALMFVGVLMALLTALGNKQYVYGALFCALLIVPMVLGRSIPRMGFLLILLIPVTFIYCYQHPKTSVYAIKLLLPGVAISAITGLVGWLVLAQGLTLV